MRIQRFLSVALAAGLAATLLSAQAPPDAPAVPDPAPPPPAIPLEARGPKVRQRVPKLDLEDQTGRRRTLASLAGPKGLVLLFVRSADW